MLEAGIQAREGNNAATIPFADMGTVEARTMHGIPRGGIASAKALK